MSPEFHWKDWCWSWSSSTLAPWCEELTHWKRPWCWERLKAGGEGDDRGWDGWMASPTRWTWVWASSRTWRAAVLGVAKSQTRLSDWTELKTYRHDLTSKYYFLTSPSPPHPQIYCAFITKGSGKEGVRGSNRKTRESRRLSGFCITLSSIVRSWGVKGGMEAASSRTPPFAGRALVCFLLE